MVALSPRFTFLAALSTLAALSAVPVSDAAVLHLRALDPTLAKAEVAPLIPSTDGKTTPMNAARFSSRDAHRDAKEYDSAPVLPLPVPKYSGTSEESKKGSGDSLDSSSSKDDNRHLSDDGSHGKEDVYSGDKKKDALHRDHGSVSEKDEKAKDKVRIPGTIGNHPHSVG
jgi:hypothetical protein